MIDMVTALDTPARSAAGRAGYDPDVLLALLLIYGYGCGERSSRRIERLCETQSGLRHITRALRGSTFDAFAALHAFPPCCCPLALSRPGKTGGPEVTSSRTSAP